MKYEFVAHIPERISEGVVYISLPHKTVIHKCCCGCGKEVVTPLSPVDWAVSFDGESVSLFPSIGNWDFECRSHYWIEKNEVIWARQWSKKQIAVGKRRDSRDKKNFHKKFKPWFN